MRTATSVLVVAAGFALVAPTPADAAPITYANAVLADSPVAYWRFSELPGATVAGDASGNGNVGTYSSTGVSLGQPGVGGGDTGALFSAGRAVVANSASLNPGTITIEALIDWTGDNGFQQRVIEKSRFVGGDLPQYGLNITPDGKVLFEIQTDSTSQSALASVHAIQAGSGVDVAASYDGTLMRIYLDGVLDSSGPALVAEPIPFDLTDVGLGNQVDRDRPFNGLIDELAIYNRALDGTQLLAHADAVGVPEPSTLLLCAAGLIGVARRRRVTRGR